MSTTITDTVHRWLGLQTLCGSEGMYYATVGEDCDKCEDAFALIQLADCDLGGVEDPRGTCMCIDCGQTQVRVSRVMVGSPCSNPHCQWYTV